MVKSIGMQNRTQGRYNIHKTQFDIAAVQPGIAHSPIRHKPSQSKKRGKSKGSPFNGAENVRKSRNSDENQDDLYQSIGGIPLDENGDPLADSSGSQRLAEIEETNVQEMEQEDYANIEVPVPYDDEDVDDKREEEVENK